MSLWLRWAKTCFGHSHCFCLERFKHMTLKMIFKECGVTSVHSQVFMTLRMIAKPWIIDPLK